MPVYEFGSREPISYVPISVEVHYEDEWRCGYCNSLVVFGENHCPYCGGEY